MEGGPILDVLIGQGPLGLIAGCLFWLYYRERERNDQLVQRVEELQTQRINDTRADLSKVAEALITSSTAIRTSENSMMALQRVVETAMQAKG